MRQKSSADAKDRRRYARLPIVDGMVELVNILFSPDGAQSRAAEAGARGGALSAAPAVLTDLSAGGLSLITFLEPPRTKKIRLILAIPGLDHVPVEGRVVRLLQKSETYNVGISFTRIGKKARERINAMAQDHGDCETRLSLKLPEACVPRCSFHSLCHKPQKGPYWKDK